MKIIIKKWQINIMVLICGILSVLLLYDFDLQTTSFAKAFSETLGILLMIVCLGWLLVKSMRFIVNNIKFEVQA